ncbi:response regulator, partial [Paracraurococcus ruber]|uniref:response regulator n=1 Tax=Paracraurococcus ruber TaxID=77675 RepID=UPI00105817B0
MPLILILDDRATNRSIFARLASVIEDDVTVEVFGDPFDALEWLEGNRVDLVITDFRMPGMDGAEFTRRFRALPGGAAAPVLVVTAHDDRSFRVRALDAGATDFLQSPIDHFELVTRARNLLALGRGRPEVAVPVAAQAAPRPAAAPP